MKVDEIEEDEKPLDPATERVRKKLVKFSAVFMGLNMLALMAVLGAIVYKIGGYGEEAEAEPAATQAGGAMALEPGFERELALPEGARILNASENAGRVLLNLAFRDGSRALWFYDVESGEIAGRIAVK